MRHRRREPAGNFLDVERLLEQLAVQPVMELGTPLPKEKYLPRGGAERCPATHNRFLLGELGKEAR